MADDRDKLVKTYRELEGHELLSLYAKREDLSPAAVDVLREELKLRGIDPDSLRPTVPRARTDEEPGADEGPRDASLAETQLPEIPEELRGEYDPSTAGWLSCPACGAPNLSSETHCRSCRAPLTDAPPPAEPAAPIAPGGPHPGTLASATLGLVGISGLLFSAYIAMLDRRAVPIAVLAAVAGAIAVGISIALYSRSRSGGATPPRAPS